MTTQLPNVGRVDRRKLEEAARRMGIPREVLDRELDKRGLRNLIFSSGQWQ